VLGVQLQNVSNQVLAWGLLWSVLYPQVHFIWLAADSFQEWRVRQTGSRIAFPIDRPMHPDADAPADPRQSTLYSWWRGEQQKSLGSLADVAAETETLAKAMKEAGLQLTVDQTHRLEGFQNNVYLLKEALLHNRQVMESLHVPVSLERFDAAYGRLLKSQNLRWVLLEFGLPVLVGVAGVVACVCMLSRPPAAVAAPYSVSVVRLVPAVSARGTAPSPGPPAPTRAACAG
jgi:hypothetical protein